jgi:outer membrane receptor protein involved in Fe transport
VQRNFSTTLSMAATVFCSALPASSLAEMEEVTVVSSRDQRGIMQTVSASETIVADEIVPHARTTADLISGFSGVELNGQGGALQTFSVRGMSRWRVQTRLGAALLNTDRRAGNSASFLDPWLINNISVVKGPQATLYGSGSIGGLVLIQPRKFSDKVMHGSLFSNGLDRKLGFGFGNESFSFGATYQKNQRNEDADGDELNDQSQQVGISLGLEVANSTLQLIVTDGSDLGKSNSDYPDSRVTNYPDEQHALLTWQKKWADWDMSLYLHDQNLETEITDADSFSMLSSESRDFGGLIQRFWQTGAFDLRAGIDVNGRADVNSSEHRFDRQNNQAAELTNLDGKQLISALLTDLQWRQGKFLLRGGLRWSYIEQEDRGRSASDDNIIGFVGISYLRNNWELYSQVGNGFRFPELTEKFFIGTTSRGSVLGNAELNPEKSTNFEVGIQINTSTTDIHLAVYTLKLKDYIERITVAPRLRTYENTAKVKVHGTEAGISGEFKRLNWGLVGHYLVGKSTEDSSSDQYIADVPAPALALQLQYPMGRGHLSAQYKYRFEWDKVNQAEIPVDNAHLLSLRYRQPIGARGDITLWCDNVLNEHYRLTTDDLSAFAPGRGFGVSFTANLE